MDSREKALEIARLVDEKGALDISIVYIGELSSLGDFLVLCSGTSERHVHAMADYVVDELKGAGQRPLGVEGLAKSKWVLVDYGDVIFHVFDEEMRRYYDIDGLWADAPLVDTGLEAGKLKEV